MSEVVGAVTEASFGRLTKCLQKNRDLHGNILQVYENIESELRAYHRGFVLEDLEGVMLEKRWRKCMGIEPTRDGFSAPHRI